ncbi:glycoside hydrolase family 3 C-terminal domain-containing protein [Actinoplanes sp. LDG1-06]|uniref:Glycoside hydrolase family 3 C-terminal domain-containing protein n=1 Tax=Paractinoplanes ovalisporus TaxID=2810368 RepID=A0ABS2AEU9_9ACTN|nr:glycoside hydrolase family 3 C-terminal domain-containing protein [Actinoplanes ovalisporus]MBM2618359.1 glycoside hydrolase family 3 C-terminal domain-containing protein [Actinoplanes ovalisporus]
MRRTLVLALLAPIAIAVTAAPASAAPALASAAPASAAPAASAAPTAAECRTYPWMDTRKSPEKRAQALLAASSQHQKYRWLVEQPANSPQQTEWTGGVVYPVQVPCTPTVVYSDGPDGVRFTPGVTAFPATIATAATFNQPLAYAKGAAQATEAFDKGKNVLLAPGLAGGRTPLSGRTPEYLGEDPLLTGLLAAAGTKGIQSRGVLATLKHYVANEQEVDRQTSSSNADERTLREIYDLPFEIAVKRGGPESVMCSYNQINHVYACENARLNNVLKDDIGFDGYVMSDFGSVHSTAPSLVNGLDQELNRPIWFTPARLDEALAAGLITQKQIDAAAFKVVRSYIRGGLFDRALPATPVEDASTNAHKAIARATAEQGSVLLKNNGLLPLNPRRNDQIAVIGATASSTPTNGVSASSVCSLPWRFGNPTTLQCEDLVSPETSIRARAARNGATVAFDNGSDLTAAATAARNADVAVVFAYVRMGEFTDLTDLRLQGNGDALIEAVAAANPRTVVVLQTGSAVEMPWLSRVPAVLETWYAGEQMGPAVASLLFGDTNPSGKLPMTFPKSLADTPTAGSAAQYPGVVTGGIRQVDYNEGLKVGYRWYDSQGIAPLFPFGHGLSYTTFKYSDLRVSASRGEVNIRVRLTNTGRRSGTEVAQAYATLPASTGEPSKRLVSFQRVTLAPGQSRTVDLSLSRSDLADLHLLQYWSGGWKTAHGTYGVQVGGVRANFRL